LQRILSRILPSTATFIVALSLTTASGAAPGPDIDVRGNGLSIPDGDVDPSIADGTDFGSVPTNTTVDRSFLIHNVGTSTLTLNGSPDLVQITGANAGDFSVIAQPPTGAIEAGGSETFTIRFSPGAAGPRVADVVIPNDDPDETGFTFRIQGTGEVFPEIDVRGNGWSIPSGDTTPSPIDDTEFGTVGIGTPVDHVFAIQNTGTGALTLGTVTVTNVIDFSVVASPSSPVAPGGSTAFTIRFDPTSAGLKSDTVEIPSDDADESPYRFDVQGTGAAAAPTVGSPSVADVEATSATLGGEITSSGGHDAHERGVFWSASQGFDPPGQGTMVSESLGPYPAEPFSVPVASPGLPAASLVYFKAFATNSAGQGFSAEQAFQTEPAAQPTGLEFSAVSSSSMTISWTPESGHGSIVVMRQGGAVTSGPSDFTLHGAVADPWNAGEELGAGNYVVYRGSGSSVTVSGLGAAATYGVAVYAYAGSGATSPGGINYQQDAPLTGTRETLAQAPWLSGPVRLAFAGTDSASLQATIDSNGGDAITSYGTVSGTSPGPDLSSHSVVAGSGDPGAGPFSHTHTGLPAGKLIYFAGYASNSVGTGYSADGSFYTEPAGPATALVVDGETYNSVDLSWASGGDGDAYDGSLVVVRMGSPVVDAPVDGVEYVANRRWSYGDELGIGNDTFVVHRGPLSSVTVTGLLHEREYHVSVYEYSGVGTEINYLLNPASGQTISLPRAPSHSSAYNECSDCHIHNRHTSFAEQGVDQKILCKGCHQPGSVASAKADVALHHTADCTDCHEIHDTGEDFDNPAGVLWTTDWRDGTTAENQNWVRGNRALYMAEPKKSLVAPAAPLIWHTGSAAELADPTGTEINASGKLDRLCQACHTNPESNTQYHTNDPFDPAIQPTDPTHAYTHPENVSGGTAGQDCRDCHAHGDGYAPVVVTTDCLAAGCHVQAQNVWRQIGESSPGLGDGDFGLGMTSHHVNDGTGNDVTTGWDCIACHAEGLHLPGDAEYQLTTYHINGTVDLRNADDAVTAHTNDDAVYVDWPALAPEARSDFCLSCHDWDGAAMLTSRPSNPADPGHATPLNPFDDDVTNHHEPDGFDGTPAPHRRHRPANQYGSPDLGVVDVKSQFHPANASHHAVLGPAYGPGSTPITAAPGGVLVDAVFGTDAHGNAITWESTLNCEDCHVDTDREGVDVGLVGHGSVNARYMLKDANGQDVSGSFDLRSLNCFGCHDPLASSGTLSNFDKHVGRDGDHMLDANNLYGIGCLNCHGGGYPDQYWDQGPVVFLPEGIPFGAIHGVPSSAATPMGYTPNLFTYGSGIETIANWESLSSPSCGALSNVTRLSNCDNHSGAGKSYTRGYVRSYRAP
jgi:hypothetical protein